MIYEYGIFWEDEAGTNKEAGPYCYTIDDARKEGYEALMNPRRMMNSLTLYRFTYPEGPFGRIGRLYERNGIVYYQNLIKKTRYALKRDGTLGKKV